MFHLNLLTFYEDSQREKRGRIHRVDEYEIHPNNFGAGPRVGGKITEKKN